MKKNKVNDLNLEKKTMTVSALSRLSLSQLQELLNPDTFQTVTHQWDHLIKENKLPYGLYFGKIRTSLIPNHYNPYSNNISIQPLSSSSYKWCVEKDLFGNKSQLEISSEGEIDLSCSSNSLALYALHYILTSPFKPSDNNSFIFFRNTLVKIFVNPQEPIYLTEVILQTKKWVFDSTPSTPSQPIINHQLFNHSNCHDSIPEIFSHHLLNEWELSSALLFKFSDGSVFNLLSLFKSPYLWLLQKELPLVRLFSRTPTETPLYNWTDHWQTNVSPTNNQAEIFLIISKILDQLRIPMGQKKIECFISPWNALDYNPLLSQKVDKFVNSTRSMKWQLAFNHEEPQSSSHSHLVQLVVQPQIPDNKKFYSTETTGFDPQQRQLYFYRNHENMDSILQKVNQQESMIKNNFTIDLSLKNRQVKDSTTMIPLPLSLTLSNLIDAFQQIGVPLATDFPLRSVSEPSQLQISFTNEDPEECTISFFVQDQNKNKFYLPSHCSSLLRILEGISGGMAGYLSSEAKNLASQNKFTRANEIKLYRHSGLFLYLLMECLSNKLFLSSPISDSEKSTDTEKASFEKHLRKKCQQVALHILEMNHQSQPSENLLKNCAGSTFVQKLNNTITKLLNENEANIQVRFQNELMQLNFNQSIKEFLNLYCNQICDHYRQQVFHRIYFPAFTYKVNPENSFLSIVVLRKGGWHRIPFVEAAPQTCTISGLLVEKLNSQDLQSQILINDSKERIDWFELNPQIYFKGEEIPLESFSSFIKNDIISFQGKYYHIPSSEIPNMKWLNYFWKLLSRTQQLHQAHKDQKKSIPYRYSEILNLLALKSSSQVLLKSNPRWNRILQEYESLGKNSKEEDLQIRNYLKKGLHTKLKDFQFSGVRWLLQLYRLGLGGILGDDMGLGKTVQTLAFLDCLSQKGELGSTLIVVPTSLTYNWINEAEKFTPELPIKVFSVKDKTSFHSTQNLNEPKIQKSHPVLITTYGLLSEHLDTLNLLNWDVIIFDEAQNLKNMKAQRTQAARTLKSAHKFCLSGTPLENHLGEFYSLMDLAVPGSLGPYSEFQQTYNNNKDNKSNDDDLEFLKLKVKPLVMRRTKELVLKELPQKTETVIHLDFDSHQEKIYKDIALSWNQRIKEIIDEDGVPKSQLQMLTALLRLRQVCSFPQMVPKIKYQHDSPKLKALISNLKELIDNNHSAVVFTQFLTSLELIQKKLKSEGLPVLSFSGQDSAKKRQSVLEQFNQNDSPYVLIMTLKTGGVGLNLTQASYVFHLEPWWNPAAENQASDRVHRLGQTQPVQIYRFIMRNSVEEKIQELKKRKSSIFSALFSESENIKDAHQTVSFSQSSLTAEDFSYLIHY